MRNITLTISHDVQYMCTTEWCLSSVTKNGDHRHIMYRVITLQSWNAYSCDSVVWQLCMFGHLCIMYCEYR